MSKPYEELTFVDDFMFTKLLTNNESLCKRFIEIVLGINVKAIKVEKQETKDVTADSKGIRLDVWAEDDQNSIYDIEMQTTISRNLPKRSRYYHSMIDLDMIQKGADYSELKKSFVVFVCTKDPIGKNKCVYTFEKHCNEDLSIVLNDETRTVFLNPLGDDINGLGSELQSLLIYINTGIPESDFTRELQTAVNTARNKKDWREQYMTIERMYLDKIAEGKQIGLAEGRAEGRAEEAKTIAKNLFLSGMSFDRVKVVIPSLDDETLKEIETTV